MATIFDYAGSLRRMGNDQGLFQDMVVLLQEDAPVYLAAIDSNHANADFNSLKRAAHTLKGLVLNFGATRAVSATIALETLASNAERDSNEKKSLSGAIVEVHAALDELQRALADHARMGAMTGESMSDGKHAATSQRASQK